MKGLSRRNGCETLCLAWHPAVAEILEAQELTPGQGFSHCIDHNHASVTEEDVAAQKQHVRSISQYGAGSRGVSHLEQPVTAQSVHHIPQVAFLALQEI